MNWLTTKWMADWTDQQTKHLKDWLIGKLEDKITYQRIERLKVEDMTK